MSEQYDVRSYYAMWAKILRPLCHILYPTTVHGAENIIDRPAIVCANHSNYIDPILIALAFGGDRVIHFMAKTELFHMNQWFTTHLLKLGAFGVDRDGADISAIRAVMKYIRAGETVGIFPEGTRVKEDGVVEAKPGAARMAAKLRVPIVPVYITRGKWLFRRVQIVIGKPIIVPNAPDTDYQAVTNEIMAEIAEMGKRVQ